LEIGMLVMAGLEGVAAAHRIGERALKIYR
jgi:hypothetical protein